MHNIKLCKFESRIHNKNGKSGKRTFHSHSSLELVYVVEGKLVIEYSAAAEDGKKKVSVEPRQFAIIRPDIVHRKNYKAKTLCIQAEFVCAGGTDIMEYIKNSEFVKSMLYTEEILKIFNDIMVLTDTQNLRFILSRIKEYCTEDKLSPLDYFAFDEEIRMLLIEFLKCYRNATECADRNGYMRKVMAYVNTYFYKPDLSVGELANQVGLSSVYLQKLFKDNMGNTVYEFITQTRIERAKNLILRTNFSIAAIAKEVGYGTEQAFIMNFKKTFGMSPDAYKKKQSYDNDFVFDFRLPDYKITVY